MMMVMVMVMVAGMRMYTWTIMMALLPKHRILVYQERLSQYFVGCQRTSMRDQERVDKPATYDSNQDILNQIKSKNELGTHEVGLGSSELE